MMIWQVPNLFSVFDTQVPTTEVKVSLAEKVIVIGSIVSITLFLITCLTAGYMGWL